MGVLPFSNGRAYLDRTASLRLNNYIYNDINKCMCNFMNFSRNILCQKCKTEGPKRVLIYEFCKQHKVFTLQRATSQKATKFRRVGVSFVSVISLIMRGMLSVESVMVKGQIMWKLSMKRRCGKSLLNFVTLLGLLGLDAWLFMESDWAIVLGWQKTGGRGPKILWKNLEDMVESFRDRVAIEVEASVLHTTDANHLWSTMAQLIKKVTARRMKSVRVKERYNAANLEAWKVVDITKRPWPMKRYIGDWTQKKVI
uniref:Uncharacterized protein n=1 Tax=Lactuca sativa TaxID=4236 RepID=A0A9R1WVS9_LACSA|nr:hypothetical protein LSAT_V11C800400660 [Lactuca sativa]